MSHFEHSYNKFSDLLTDTAIAVEKTKDLRGDVFPPMFLIHADMTIDAYKQSRKNWSEKIQADSAELKMFCDYLTHRYWSTATLHLTYCLGIAEKRTNVNELAIEQVAEIIELEQESVRIGILKAKDYRDPVLASLSKEAIVDRLKRSLVETNAPSSPKPLQ